VANFAIKRAFQTHIHIIPRKACDCLWASEVKFHLLSKFDARWIYDIITMLWSTNQ